jgi:hypothetical protein
MRTSENLSERVIYLKNAGDMTAVPGDISLMKI